MASAFIECISPFQNLAFAEWRKSQMIGHPAFFREQPGQGGCPWKVAMLLSHCVIDSKPGFAGSINDVSRVSSWPRSGALVVCIGPCKYDLFSQCRQACAVMHSAK